MPATATPLPACRADLVVRPVGDAGQCVVKDPGTGEFFQLGPHEHFLLTQLDGRRAAAAVCAAFADRFGQELSEDELAEFVESIREQGLLGDPAGPEPGKRRGGTGGGDRQSLLYWRKSVFDPDRLFNRLEPRLRFFWTRGFLAISAGCIAFAAVVVWANRDQVAGSFLDALRWETAFWAWLTLFVVTLLHEFAHGLTCKHYGGEVHEVGFLSVLFLPCFYCNVSDAWLFKEKSKRLWVTFAGGYFELFLWALAVFAWRLSVPGTFPHYLAFVVVTACGVQTLFNFIPLLKLDGYYLLSDWAGVPNLKQRADDHAKGRLRRLLWGAPGPDDEPGGRLLLAFGLASLVFSLGFLAASLGMIGQWAWAYLGWAGLAAVGVLGVLGLRGLLKGLCAGEVGRMIRTRHRRTAIWLIVLGGTAAALGLIELPDRAGGPFQVRSAVRVEVRAPVAGFLREVHGDEGDRVSPGAPLVRLEVPDLAARLAQKRAEVRQAEARLHLLEEEVAEQRRRVGRAERWRDRAEADLERAGRVLAADLAGLDQAIAQAQAEAEAAAGVFARSQAGRGAVSPEQLQEAERRNRAAQAQVAQARADRRAREAKGVSEAKLELDRRERALAEDRAALAVLETGTRPKELEAERARLEGLRADEAYLLGVQAKLVVYSPVPGVVTTPRLKEKVGQYVREGDLICLVEEPDALEAEVTVSEQDAGRVRVGQPVGLKARSLVSETFTARVDRVAPAAVAGDGQSTVTVYCRLAGTPLRPGMSGYARVYGDQRSVGGFLLSRAVRFVRTEFWW